MTTLLTQEARDEASLAPGHLAGLLVRLADALETAHRRAATPARQPLTRHQAKLLRFLEAYIRERGYAPNLSEIASELEVSSLSTVSEHLGNLEAKGWITRQPYRARAIRLLGEDGR